MPPRTHPRTHSRPGLPAAVSAAVALAVAILAGAPVARAAEIVPAMVAMDGSGEDGVVTADLPALPREGFGAGSRGGAGGAVLTVTSLEDSGAGTLRWAVEEVEGPRVVVFGVEGEIALRDAIAVDRPFLTIDGRTAPGDGVLVTGARLHVRAGHVIVTGMQFSPGDGPGGDDPRNRDGLSLGTGAHDVLVTGNSFTWSVDENVAVWGDVRDVSILYNMIGEALRDSIHVHEEALETAPHSMGVILGASEDEASPRRISIARNLLFSNEFRNPYVKDGVSVEFVNNYVHNYGAGHQGLSVGGGRRAVTLSVRANVYEDGADTTDDGRPPFDLRHRNPGSSILLEDNLSTRHRETLADPEVANVHGSLDVLVSATPFEPSGLEILPPDRVVDDVLARVGAFGPSGERRRRDAAFLAKVERGEARIVDGTGSPTP